jgi:GntR family transcriptional regulator/MocR family aminotransferase
MLRPWTLNILLRRQSEAAVHQQIANALIEEIREGRLAPGSALPGSRALADHLKVNRKTVIQAYDELVAQGWLTAGTTRGTTVSADFPVVEQAPAGMRSRSVPVATQPDFPLGTRTPNVRYLGAAKGMLTFDDGAPDTRLAPVEELARAYRRALMDAVRGNRLGYGDPRGSIRLRKAVATMLHLDRGISCTVDNICLVRGSQMGIYLAARLLVRPGDVVVMEALSYPPAREAFLAAGAEIATVELDAQGLKVDQLERLCRTRRVRAVYITPHHQFRPPWCFGPSGGSI